MLDGKKCLRFNFRGEFFYGHAQNSSGHRDCVCSTLVDVRFIVYAKRIKGYVFFSRSLANSKNFIWLVA